MPEFVKHVTIGSYKLYSKDVFQCMVGFNLFIDNCFKNSGDSGKGRQNICENCKNHVQIWKSKKLDWTVSRLYVCVFIAKASLI